MPGPINIQINVGKNITTIANQFPKAASASLNRIAQGARTELSRDVREEYNIKAADVSKNIVIANATKDNLRVIIRARGSNLPFFIFDPRQTAQGVSIMIKTGARKVKAGAFLATMKSGHKGVFIREGKKRLPIDEKYTIGLPQMITSKNISDKLVAFVQDKLPAELVRTIKAFIDLGRE